MTETFTVWCDMPKFSLCKQKNSVPSVVNLKETP